MHIKDGYADQAPSSPSAHDYKWVGNSRSSSVGDLAPPLLHRSERDLNFLQDIVLVLRHFGEGGRVDLAGLQLDQPFVVGQPLHVLNLEIHIEIIGERRVCQPLCLPLGAETL